MKRGNAFVPKIADDTLVKTSILVRILALVTLLFIIPLEGLLREVLSNWGTGFIYDLQQDRTDSGKDFFRLVSYLGTEWMLIAVAPAFYHLCDPRRGIKVIFISCFSMYLYSFIALFYKEPRPFWVDDDLRSVLCRSGYANPAAEILLGSVLYCTTAIEFFHRSRFRILAYSLTVTLLILLSCGTVYLGEYFPHQIFITFCYAFIYLTALFVFDKLMMDFTLKSCFNYKTNRVYVVYWFIVTMFLLLGVVSIYDIVTLNHATDISWIKNATTHCNWNYDVGGASTFYKSAWIFYNLGFVTGSMFTAKYLSMFWGCTSLWKSFLRYAISAGISIGIYKLFSLIVAEDTTTEYMWKYAFPLFLIAYICAGLLPLFFSKIQLALDVPPDIDEENELKSIGKTKRKL
ncbi:unnamed protein product [Blepharisma stoltei]|uniref:Phosphatidic acid phosphatase type 2/haloperoxidase domain-containing protein n=1 Tax=Blepharisma stoltei TaxID=1481888 RepID=A0AAU9J8A7_9CILI|nr:unnamed protein product [Blepharisma stoltei]